MIDTIRFAAISLIVRALRWVGNAYHGEETSEHTKSAWAAGMNAADAETTTEQIRRRYRV